MFIHRKNNTNIVRKHHFSHQANTIPITNYKPQIMMHFAINFNTSRPNNIQHTASKGRDNIQEINNRYIL